MTASLGIGTGTPGYEMKLAPAAVRSSFLFAEPKMRTLQKFVHMAGQERGDKKDPMSVSSKFQRLLVILVQNISEVLPSIGPVLVTSDNFHSFRIFFQVDRGRKKSLSLKTPNLGNQIQDDPSTISKTTISMLTCAFTHVFHVTASEF